MYFLTPYSNMCLCIACILVLIVASSSLFPHLAICGWVYYLHFLCCYYGLLHSISFPCCTHRLLVYMCFIFFIVSSSLFGYPVAYISSATNKWNWKCVKEGSGTEMLQVQQEKNWKIWKSVYIIQHTVNGCVLGWHCG